MRPAKSGRRDPVDAYKRHAVDEVVTPLEQHILETKREVLAAARLA